jgi:hypothetical protein
MNAFDNDNHIPDGAFGEQPVTTEQATVSTVFEPPSLAGLTLEERFAIAKATGMAKANDKFGELFGQEVVPENSIADQIRKAETSKVTQHSDGSITVKKGVIGNDQASTELLKIIRERAYFRHNIQD